MAPRKPTARAQHCKKISKNRASRQKRQKMSRRFSIGLLSFSILTITTAIGWGWNSGAIRNAYDHTTQTMWNSTADAGFSIQHVYLSGHHKVTRQMVLEKVPLTLGQPALELSLDDMKAALEEIPLVQKAELARSLPDSLHIRITERKPIALWQRDGTLVPVDVTGVILQDKIDGAHSHLPMIVGTRANQQVATLLSMMETAPQLVKHLDAAIWVGSRRWDIQLKNGMTVKLPEDNASAAWNRLSGLVNEHALLEKEIRVIDMRLADRLFIEPIKRSGLSLAGNNR